MSTHGAVVDPELGHMDVPDLLSSAEAHGPPAAAADGTHPGGAPLDGVEVAALAAAKKAQDLTVKNAVLVQQLASLRAVVAELRTEAAHGPRGADGGPDRTVLVAERDAAVAERDAAVGEQQRLAARLDTMQAAMDEADAARAEAATAQAGLEEERALRAVAERQAAEHQAAVSRTKEAHALEASAATASARRCEEAEVALRSQRRELEAVAASRDAAVGDAAASRESLAALQRQLAATEQRHRERDAAEAALTVAFEREREQWRRVQADPAPRGPIAAALAVARSRSPQRLEAEASAATASGDARGPEASTPSTAGPATEPSPKHVTVAVLEGSERAELMELREAAALLRHDTTCLEDEVCALRALLAEMLNDEGNAAAAVAGMARQLADLQAALRDERGLRVQLAAAARDDARRASDAALLRSEDEVASLRSRLQRCEAALRIAEAHLQKPQPLPAHPTLRALGHAGGRVPAAHHDPLLAITGGHHVSFRQTLSHDL